MPGRRSLPLISFAIRGAWRAAPEPLPRITESVVEPAIRGGAGALLARRIGEATVIDDHARALLRDVVRHQVLEAARFERGLETRLRALGEIGIRPILLKGWSIARRYPKKGLRHYSDLDLAVAPHERRRAEEVLARFGDDRVPVDLHDRLPHLRGRDAGEVARRLRPVPLGDAEVVTLGDEDHLWLLALHALGHGAWRPVWLCDLAVLVEERGRALDWDYLFAGPRRDADAVRVALSLARDVLGAKLDGTPLAASPELPAWIGAALNASWDEGPRAYAPLTSLPRHDLVRELRRRWPNPIRATAALHAPWNDWPRAPFQLLDAASRALRFALTRDAEAGIWRR